MELSIGYQNSDVLWEIAAIVEEIKVLVNQMRDCSITFNYVTRKVNRVVD